MISSKISIEIGCDVLFSRNDFESGIDRKIYKMSLKDFVKHIKSLGDTKSELWDMHPDDHENITETIEFMETEPYDDGLTKRWGYARLSPNASEREKKYYKKVLKWMLYNVSVVS